MCSVKKKMAWVLVKWVPEGTVSTIPAGWILEPAALPPKDKLPVKGKCYWKRKGNSLETLFLAVSGKYLLILLWCMHIDTKAELESKALEYIQSSEERGRKDGSNADEEDRERDDEEMKAKARVKRQRLEDKRSKKQAELATAEHMAQNILVFIRTHQSVNDVQNCNKSLMF